MYIFVPTKNLKMDYEKLFTVREASQRLKLKETTLTKMIRNKEIIAYKVGKKWLLKEIDLHLFTENKCNV
jgi:excisionase family DNA binding protein